MYPRKKILFHCITTLSLLLCFTFFTGNAIAQQVMIDFDIPVVKDTKTENRLRLYKSLVNGLNKNLSLPLTDSTEENWMDAFYSMELLRYKTPWVENKLHEAFKEIEKRTPVFQYSLIECVYDAYPVSFIREVERLMDTTGYDKCFAACAEYLLKQPGANRTAIFKNAAFEKEHFKDNIIVHAARAQGMYSNQKVPPLADLVNHTFFSNAKIVFSFQRKNRNYPGIAVVRDSAGNFVKDNYGNIFFVPQLARSITNLPGYLSNGNTPQGIFRMKGFDVGKSIFIGPTPNIQLTMPGETGISDFFNDSTIADSIWTADWYTKRLPASWKNYHPVRQTLWAGLAGRTEIIAHGTTVDPSYYKNTTYYPLTPTLGCLCTKEIWDEENGKRTYSDQQKLVDAVNKAGGADGYYIVVELDDQQNPVSIGELLPYLK